jgi:hypothetical protein
MLKFGEKLKLSSLTGKIIYLILPFVLAIWALMYLYFLSSSPLPANLYDYEELLRVNEQALRSALIRATILNSSAAELSKIYESLTQNEICTGDFLAAEKHMHAALFDAPARLNVNKQALAVAWLKTANLNRDAHQFDLAKVNYGNSLHYLNQIAFGRDFREAFNATAINFNNLAVIYFLMGQQSTDHDERQECYLTAIDYLVRAKNLTAVLGSNQNQCFQQNLDENLNQCIAERQFSH